MQTAGKVRVLFGEESGFTENPPLTQAWAPKGAPHAHQMKTGTRARLNGIGLLRLQPQTHQHVVQGGARGQRRFQGVGPSPGSQMRPARANTSMAGQRPHPHGSSHPGLVSRVGVQGADHSFLAAIFSRAQPHQNLVAQDERLRPFVLLEIKALRIALRKILKSLLRKR